MIPSHSPMKSIRRAAIDINGDDGSDVTSLLRCAGMQIDDILLLSDGGFSQLRLMVSGSDLPIECENVFMKIEPSFTDGKITGFKIMGPISPESEA